jgi:predicted homoserine dehydrogenase-like protein
MARVLLDALRSREAAGRPLRVGVMGAGSFGVGLIAQLAQAPGMAPSAVADLDPDAALRAYVAAGCDPADVLCTEHVGTAADAVRAGRPVIVPDGRLLAELPLDASVDSTGVPDAGATVAAACLRAGQHVIMVNVEADVAVGAALRRVADANGVVYTLADGDQPSLICSLADWATSLGLEVIAGGKGTSLWPPGHPTRVVQEQAPDANLVDLMYYEGSKSQMEMASAANCLGWGVDVRGMHHPSARLEEIATLFGPRGEGGVFARVPTIDFVNCRTPDGDHAIDNPISHGVFVVATSAHAATRSALARKGVPMSADGSRALLWRPFHLVGAETPYSVAQAVLFGTGTASPLLERTVEVIAVAKRDLAAGTLLNGMGGNLVLGLAENATAAARARLLPLGLADGVRLRRPVAAGEALTYDDLAGFGETPTWALLRAHGLLPEESPRST